MVTHCTEIQLHINNHKVSPGVPYEIRAHSTSILYTIFILIIFYANIHQFLFTLLFINNNLLIIVY